MNRSNQIHAAWGLVALSTFAFGLHLAGSRKSEHSPQHDLTAMRPLLEAPSQTPPGSMARKLPPEARGNEATSPSSLRPMTTEQLEAMAKQALNDPNPLTRNLAFSKLLESMTPENVGAMMESLKTNRAGGDQWKLFLYAWGSMDGPGAIAHAATLEGGRKTRFLAEALPGWASKNPTAAIAWLDTMAEGDEKNRYRGSLVAGLADRDIAQATAYVYDRANAGDKQAMGYLQTVAGEEMRKNGPAGATAWGESLADGPLKAAALDHIAGAFASRNPEAAAAWAAKFATADYAEHVIGQVGDKWAERDPKAAIAWLGTLQEGEGRSQGTFTALREWTRRDAIAASGYLAAMPPSGSKDSAVSGFARSLAREDPESAIIWAKTITNETSRLQTLTRAGQSWFRRDPAAATTWLQSASLPEASQQAILNAGRDGRGRPRG